jgi:23S rRNA (uracil-5-)-methyltransferase RumA
MNLFSTYSKNNKKTDLACPHFACCGGCKVKEDLNSPASWHEVFDFFHSLNKEIEPNLYSSSLRGFRCKAKLAISKKENKIFLGLYKENSHEVVDIPNCQAHHPLINHIAKILKKVVINNDLSIYNENTHKGLISYFQIFIEKKSKKAQVTVVVREKENDPKVKNLIKILLNLYKNYSCFHSIWINFHSEKNNVILGKQWKKIAGPSFLWQNINGQKIAFHPAAFCQVHLLLFEKMLKDMSSFLTKGRALLDIYSGVGSIGLNFFSHFDEIVFVEENPFAKISFDETKKRFFSEKNTKFYLNKIEKTKINLDLFDTVVVDPPRKGIHKNILDSLGKKKSGALVYVSCCFSTFKRDCLYLLEKGWEIKKADGYLFFPGSEHIEIMAFFKK